LVDTMLLHHYVRINVGQLVTFRNSAEPRKSTFLFNLRSMTYFGFGRPVVA